ncbi:MAG TPA: glycosyltransferase [Saprospiraceae bacterium]|nr:glycosyltransferase [Saprospiraceae bacterium]
MNIVAYILFALYLICLLYILVYSIFQLQLLLIYIFKKKNYTKLELSSSELPMVTIQLPVFNEKYVVNRIIDQIALFNYPKEKLQIQVLDDSTDETLDLSIAQVEKYKNQGFDIELLHRKNRAGYKAGALKSALEYAKGEYVAIFDADFIPESNFLLDTLPFFHDDQVALVQTRWEHINQYQSLLTQLQAFQLNVHFSVEQKGRELGNYFLQFNGTAGIWRKSAIDDAGGWHSDTLTEDLDLSYRTQLKDWKIIYLEEIGSPAELPMDMQSLKSQQYRWMKGGAENLRKLLASIWLSDERIGIKLHGTYHLMSSSIFLVILLLGVLSLPLTLLKKHIDFNLLPLNVFWIPTIILLITYTSANYKYWTKWQNPFVKIVQLILRFPLIIIFSMGLTWHNALAVISGLRQKPSPFVRTPKYGINTNYQGINKLPIYVNIKNVYHSYSEGILALLFFAFLIFSYHLQVYAFILLQLFMFLGFSSIFIYSIKK